MVIYMEQNAILEGLMKFGLTRQEAVIYLTLYRDGEMTGYEAAKLTGISRSNVYSALSGLADKGAVYLEEGNTSRYQSVPVEEFCANKIRELAREKEELIRNIPAAREKEIGYLTISGYRNIWAKAENMIREAGMRIYISAAWQVIERLQNELLDALKRDIKVVLITDREPANELLRKKGICYIGGERGSDIRLIIDSAYALTGEIKDSNEAACLYTGQENFIRVFKDALSNEIKLIQIKGGEMQ